VAEVVPVLATMLPALLLRTPGGRQIVDRLGWDPSQDSSYLDLLNQEQQEFLERLDTCMGAADTFAFVTTGEAPPRPAMLAWSGGENATLVVFSEAWAAIILDRADQLLDQLEYSQAPTGATTITIHGAHGCITRVTLRDLVVEACASTPQTWLETLTKPVDPKAVLSAAMAAQRQHPS